jgi:hypothetical protein
MQVFFAKHKKMSAKELCMCCCSHYSRRLVGYLLHELELPSVSLHGREGITKESLSEALLPQLVPCSCQFGDYVLTGLSNRFHWCVCSPETCLLSAFEKPIRDEPEKTMWRTMENYQKSALVIRKACYDATLCTTN